MAMIGDETFSMISDSTDGSSPLLFSALCRKAANAWRKGSQGSLCEGNLSPVIPSQSFERTSVDENVITTNVPSESSSSQLLITYDSQADLFDSQKSSDHTDQLNKKMKLSEDSQFTKEPLIHIGSQSPGKLKTNTVHSVGGSQSPGKLKTNTAHSVSGSQSVEYDKLLVEFPTCTQSYQALPDSRKSLQPIKLDDDAVSMFSTSTIPPVQDTYCPSGQVLLFSPIQSGHNLSHVPQPKNVHPCNIQNSSSSSSDITNPSMTSRNVCHDGSVHPSVGMAAQDITQSLHDVSNNFIQPKCQSGVMVHSSCKNKVDLPSGDNSSMKELNNSLHRNPEKSSASIVKSTKRSADIVATAVSAAVKMVNGEKRTKVVETQFLNCRDDGKRSKNDSLQKEKVLLKSSQVHQTEVDTLNRLINLYKTTLEKIPEKKPTDKLLDKLQHITEKLIQSHKEEKIKLKSFHTRSGHIDSTKRASKRYETLVKQLEERQALLHAAQSHHQELLCRISSLEDKEKPQRSIDIQLASRENIDESLKDITTKNDSFGAKETGCYISSSRLFNSAMKQPALQSFRASQSCSTGVASVQLSSEEQEIHCLKTSQNVVDQNSHDQHCHTGSLHAEVSLSLPMSTVTSQTDTVVSSNSAVDETQLDLVKLSNSDSVLVKDHCYNKTEVVADSLNLCLAGGVHKGMQTQMTQTCDLELFDSCSEGSLPRIAGISSVVENKGLNSMPGLSQLQAGVVMPEIDHGMQKLCKEKHVGEVCDVHVNEVETALIDDVVNADLSCDMVGSRHRHETEPYKLNEMHLESLALGSELECSTLGKHISHIEEDKSKNQPSAVLSCMNYQTGTTQEVNINAADKIKGDVITPNKSVNRPPSLCSTNSSSVFPVSSKEIKRRIESRVANLNKSVSLPLSLNLTNPTDRSAQRIIPKPLLPDNHVTDNSSKIYHTKKMAMKNVDLQSSSDHTFLTPSFSPQCKTQQLEVSRLTDRTMTHSQRPVTLTSVLASKTTVKEKPCRKKGRPKKCDLLKGDNMCSSKKSKKNLQISIREYFPIVNEDSSVQCADTFLSKNSVHNELLVLGKNSEQKDPVGPFQFTDRKKTDIPKSLDASEQACNSVSFDSGRDTEVQTSLATVGPISTIKSIQTIALIADSEVTNTSQDFPDAFWEESFADISMSKAFWDSVDVW
ncbi:uncharacterized protein LOC106062356 [Biomphalaria glabrata]|uniref:Uncharacterized protein LOC106062356 n=1 Tax=Biomphalaria glabrata TaxID=6526 RepID=A0A9W2YJW8_BIOGL|nr:uncharacterized protein LOC106062356 [Biomphalaria glabrata]